MLSMKRLLGKTVALVAVYAIAMQALLSGLVIVAHASIDPVSVMCASDSSGNPGSLPAHDRHDCGPCALSCGGGSPTPPSDATAFLVPFVSRVQQPTPWSEVLPARPRHHLQASRAPPILA